MQNLQQTSNSTKIVSCSSTFYRRWQAKLLQYEIQQKNKTSNSLWKQFDALNFLLSISLSPLLSDVVWGVLLIGKYVAQTKTVHCAKLERLGVNNDTSLFDPDKTVFNFSSVCLSLTMYFIGRVTLFSLITI